MGGSGVPAADLIGGDSEALAPLGAAALQHQAAVLGGHPDQKPVRPATPAIVRLIRPLHCCKALKRDLRPLQTFEQADRTSNGIQLAGNVSIVKRTPLPIHFLASLVLHAPPPAQPLTLLLAEVDAFRGGCAGRSVITSGTFLTRTEHP